MNPEHKGLNRRKFLQSTAMTTIGAGAFGIIPTSSFANSVAGDEINIIGPVDGYSPQIGILVSMLNWIRDSVVRVTRNLSQQDLDYLDDPDANTIGAMLLHLAATDALYQDLTFYNLKDFSDANKNRWEAAMGLGEQGRTKIKGNNFDYYLSALTEVREKTLSEFKKRDDKWFAEVDPSFFGNKPTNNFCKWFHVCEHEANHRGQITVIKKRLPGKQGATGNGG
ncbi:MAG TPA: DinB family protein [Chitinophagaceae bacterium]|nr:DinB family protein [Chitinophagaceae bacterium]